MFGKTTYNFARLQQTYSTCRFSFFFFFKKNILFTNPGASIMQDLRRIKIKEVAR